MLAWVPDRLVEQQGLDLEAIRAASGEPRSHDDIAHTLLALYGVRTALLREELALLSENRRAARARSPLSSEVLPPGARPPGARDGRIRQVSGGS